MVKRSTLTGLGVICLSVAASLLAFPEVPERIAIHWDVTGAPDDYASKSVGLFLLPAASVLLLGFFAAVPRIDPLSENIERFRDYYDGFVLATLLFLLYVHLLLIASNLGYDFDMTTALLPAVGVLFYAAGAVMERAERNWFVGIRTPWTLSSEEVWDRTHRLGAVLFKLSGVIAVFGVFAGEYAVAFVAAPAAATAVITTLYSFYAYRQVESDGDGVAASE